MSTCFVEVWNEIKLRIKSKEGENRPLRVIARKEKKISAVLLVIFSPSLLLFRALFNVTFLLFVSLLSSPSSCYYYFFSWFNHIFHFIPPLTQANTNVCCRNGYPKTVDLLTNPWSLKSFHVILFCMLVITLDAGPSNLALWQGPSPPSKSPHNEDFYFRSPEGRLGPICYPLCCTAPTVYSSLSRERERCTWIISYVQKFLFFFFFFFF